MLTTSVDFSFLLVKMQARSETRVSPNGMASHWALGGNVYSPTYQGLQYCLANAGSTPGQKGESPTKSINHYDRADTSIDDMSQAFGALNIHTLGSNGTGKGTVPGVPSNMIQLAGNYTQPNNAMVYVLGDGRSFVANATGPQSSYHQTSLPYSFAPNGQYMQQPNYQAAQATTMWNGNQQVSNDVPELAAPRHNSLSSNEETGPRTPFFGGQTPASFQPKVIAPENSPQTWGTPSPQQIAQSMQPQQLAKTANGQYVVIDLDAMCLKEPAIPKPIPAIFSGDKGRGTLESSLVNRFNTTNVYIRGLHPDTSDEMLFAYGARFGSIESAKSMLDQHSNLCKGFVNLSFVLCAMVLLSTPRFGFIKYHNFSDGENCIRGFFHWGYEAKWARV